VPADAETTVVAARRLIELLDLEQIEQNLYLGRNESRGGFRLFGGQVLAQAARAAYNTVDAVGLHSLHAYFLRAGDSERPVLYEVERIRDGQSFTTRRVVAIQKGEAIFNMDVSFQNEEPGFEHADPVPNVPLPHELEDDILVARSIDDPTRISPFATRVRPFESRSVFRLGSEEANAARFFNPVWIRFPLEIDPALMPLRHCLLAYASDMGLVSTGALPHQQEVRRDALGIGCCFTSTLRSPRAQGQCPMRDSIRCKVSSSRRSRRKDCCGLPMREPERGGGLAEQSQSP
jgi:acyl-CoA thioesterase-2